MKFCQQDIGGWVFFGTAQTKRNLLKKKKIDTESCNLIVFTLLKGLASGLIKQQK